MIKKFVETKRIKEIIVRSRIGKKIWIAVTCFIYCVFFLRLYVKKLIKLLGIHTITVRYDHPSKIQGIGTQIIEPVRYPLNSSLLGASGEHPCDKIPQPISSFISKKHYDHIVSRIPHGRLFGRSTIATQDNTIIRHLTRRPHKGYAGNPRAYMFKPSQVIKKPGTAIVLTGNDTFQNLNHWLTFGLAKYYLYEKAGVKPDWYILDNQKGFHKEAWEALGIPKDRIIVPGTDTVYEFDTLVAANTSTIWGIVPPRMSQFIRGLFLPPTLPRPTRKLYLKRTGTRRVLNEREFDAYLESLGFEIISTSASKSESLDRDMFMNASHVISPHGAGLTKIIFCQPHTKVIELFHPETFFGHYYAFCQSLGLEYHCFIGTKDRSYQGLDMDAPIIIDMKKFKEFMEIMNK